MKKWIVPTAVFATTVVLVGLMNAFKPSAGKRQPTRPPAIPVEVVQVQRGDYQVLIPSQGLVEAVTQATLAAEVSGNVVAKSENFEIGGSFSKGDMLVTIDDRDYRVALKLAKADASRARVNLEEEQARSAQAIRDWERIGKSEPPSELVARKPQLAAAEAQLESAQAQVDKAALDLERTRIKAPFDGRVLDGAIDVGNYVSRGMALGQIVESGKLQVQLPISARWRNMLDWQAESFAATIYLDGEGTGESVSWPAVVKQSSADVDRQSRQFSLLAQILDDNSRNLGSGLFIGDYVSASVKGLALRDVIVVPRHAIQDGSFVWVVSDSKLVKREVEVRWTDADISVVGAGLEAGEQVNLTPVGSVVSGTQVRIREPGKSNSLDVAGGTKQ